MARAKPRWRKVLNARFLRWWLARLLVRAVPALGARLAFFPEHSGLVESADRVLANEKSPVVVPPEDRAFVERCLTFDATADGLDLDHVVTGRRTVLFERAWIDIRTGSILLPDQARTVLTRGPRANWNATSVHLRRPRIKVPGRAFGPLASANYFHLILENGIRLLDLLDSALLDGPLTVVKGPDRSRVEQALYQGIAAIRPQVSVREMPANAIAVADEVVGHFPRGDHWEWPPVDRVLGQSLAAAFEAVYGPQEPTGSNERLYLSRRDAKLRQLENEDTVLAALEDQGFRAFTATDTNHPEQIARFRAARTVVSVHGAGLTNLVFCQPGTQVIEIFPSNFVKSTYWWLAHRLDLRYRAVIGGPGNYDQCFSVDPRLVADALAEM